MPTPTEGTVATQAIAAQMAVEASDLVVHINPVQARALLRVAADLFEAAGQQSRAELCRGAVEKLKEAKPRERHRPGLGSSPPRLELEPVPIADVRDFPGNPRRG